MSELSGARRAPPPKKKTKNKKTPHNQTQTNPKTPNPKKLKPNKFQGRVILNEVLSAMNKAPLKKLC